MGTARPIEELIEKELVFELPDSRVEVHVDLLLVHWRADPRVYICRQCYVIPAVS